MLKKFQKIEKYLFIVAPLLILASLFYYYITNKFELFSIVTMVAGVVIGLLFFLRFYDDIVKRITKRKVRYGVNSAIITVVVLALIVIVYLVTFSHNKRFDLTASKRFSLSSQTVALLGRLQGPVKVYAFFSKQQSTAGISELLNEYRYHKNDLSFEVIDPDVNPGKVKDLGVEEYGQVVVEWGGKTEKVKANTEEGITNTLIKLSQTEPKIVYFATGHGERSIEDYGNTGYDKIKAAIETENYKVKDILLLREQNVPDDCAVLVSAGPKTDYSDYEISLIDEYVKKGGRVFFLLDPVTEAGVGDLKNIISFADKYGILIGNDVIIDPLSRVLSGDYFMPVINSYTYSPITKDFRIATFMRMVRSVDTKDGAGEKVFARTMANTGESSWAETGIADMKAGRPVRFDEGKDKKGPVPIMAYSTVTVSGPASAASSPAGAGSDIAESGDKRSREERPAGPSKKKSGKNAFAEEKPAPEEPEKKEIDAIVMVAGDSDFISNSMYQTQGNKDLFLNSLNYLADRGDLITIRPKQQESVYLTLTAQQGRVAFFVSIILVPLIVIVAGLYINIQRRVKS
jgi:ABC-type uncharacterized transport system involved in gliding motility auxiliary subunit